MITVKKFINYVILVFFFIFSIFTNCQTYQVKYTDYIEINKDSLIKTYKNTLGEELINSLIPQLGKPKKFILTYCNEMSIYRKYAENEISNDELNVGQTNSIYNFNNINDDDLNIIVFKDFKNNKLTTQDYILDKKFLIKDTLNDIKWNITNNTKQYGDFICREATFIDEENNLITGCYIEEIPIFDGPEMYYGLPGLIVEIKFLNRVIQMTELQYIKENMDTIEPTEGKNVSRKEFKKILKDKSEY